MNWDIIEFWLKTQVPVLFVVLAVLGKILASLNCYQHVEISFYKTK